MDSNSYNLTQENMTRNTSLTSLESGCGYLNGLEVKEQMDVEIGLFSNKIEKKKKDAKIFVKPGNVTNSFEDLIGKTNDNVKKSWGSITNWFSSINYNRLASLLNKFLAATFLLLIFVLVTAFFSYYFIYFITYSINSKKSLDSTIFFGSLILSAFLLIICFYFICLHKSMRNLHPSLTNSKCFSTLFKILPNIFVFILALLLLIFMFSTFHLIITWVTGEDKFGAEEKIGVISIVSLSFVLLLYIYFARLKAVMDNYPFTMDSIEKFFFKD
ncbi:unnamed protein product [Meloidogyne enterolobii]|uniref:Uncharacterized protein n=1 Tax=Meloidogyne enterolobii TaxID=390850 RepID=A0ACB1AXE2_MELEN